MFEQQSAFAVQRSLSTLQSVVPQTPPLQPSEQQSSALVQATPSATQRFVHCRTPDMPVTGSQRPLQQSPSAAQVAPEVAHWPAVAVAPPAPTAPPVPVRTTAPPWPPLAVGPPSTPARPFESTPPQAANERTDASTAMRDVRERIAWRRGEFVASMPYRAESQTDG
jgi:hypothetical protein